MEIFQDYLKEQGVKEEQIIAVNLEDYDFYELHEPARLYAYIKERISQGYRTYVFLDEIQHCEDFPGVVDSLSIKRNVDVYLTGSNAYMLSGVIVTLISGRYVEIKMLPLSFSEYVSAVGIGEGLQRRYTEYLTMGSFPYTLEFKGKTRENRDYLEGIYNTIVVKDIAARKKILDIMMLQSATRFIFDSIGSQISTKKIADTMTSNGRKIDVKTVERYIGGLMESFIVYEAKRYNIRGKQYLKTLEKYYVADLGLRHMLLGARGTDVGHMLENVISLELKRRGYEVYVGKMDELEADYEGIHRINALDWLMGSAK
jgi:Predicted ATPase (AAA+ superfamily)